MMKVLYYPKRTKTLYSKTIYKFTHSNEIAAFKIRDSITSLDDSNATSYISPYPKEEMKTVPYMSTLDIEELIRMFKNIEGPTSLDAIAIADKLAIKLMDDYERYECDSICLSNIFNDNPELLSFTRSILENKGVLCCFSRTKIVSLSDENFDDPEEVTSPERRRELVHEFYTI